MWYFMFFWNYWKLFSVEPNNSEMKFTKMIYGCSLLRRGDGAGGAQGHTATRLQCQPATQQSCALPAVWTPAEARQEQTQDQQCKTQLDTHIIIILT